MKTLTLTITLADLIAIRETLGTFQSSKHGSVIHAIDDFLQMPMTLTMEFSVSDQKLIENWPSLPRQLRHSEDAGLTLSKPLLSVD